MPEIERPNWMLSDSEEEEREDDNNMDKNIPKEPQGMADSIKLKNLLKRRSVYGDITQNATEAQLVRLLVNTF